MAVYAIGDLHLSFQVNKPMDVFGKKWTDYEKSIQQSWSEQVSDNDVVIIPGDFSWATYLNQAISDFSFINQLPGRKIILKGNHDYWWETVSKMNHFLDENNFHNIEFLFNNSIELDDCVICGTKGYSFDETDEKMINREIERFKISLKSIKNKEKDIIAVFHFPPMHSDIYMNLIEEHMIKKVIYGHIHGEKTKEMRDDDVFNLVSADFLYFNVRKIY
ncbi:MAG: metallophosphoesterase [Clostridia bacterium]|nr:metallophosphoesterase [Clostridia bacterium]